MGPETRMIGLAAESGITLTGFLPLSACRVTRDYLLSRAGIHDGTVMMMAVPYYTRACDGPRNLSAYAVGRDYHQFFKTLWDKWLPLLREEYPANSFAGFADHSPIAEVEAASAAGLGVIGQNGLLLTEKWSSYVFLGTLVTDAVIPCEAGQIRRCEGCGACQRACPASLPEPRDTQCLSALTQKKGDLSDQERSVLRSCGSVWGCDACQEVCPHTKKAKSKGSIYTNISFFEENPISELTSDILEKMSDKEFEERAWAWRGRSVVERNLKIMEENV